MTFRIIPELQFATAADAHQNLLNFANVERSRSLIRPLMALLMSYFLYTLTSLEIAEIWLIAILLIEGIGFWLCLRVNIGNFRYGALVYAYAVLSSLLWVASVVPLWYSEDLVHRVGAVMCLLSIAFFSTISAFYSRRLLLLMVLPPLAALCYLIISYLAEYASPIVALMAGLATLGSCAIIVMNGFILNASDRKLRCANKVLARVAETARLASEAKSSFLANMSHEIRTPLNGILGIAQAMTLGRLAPEQRDLLTVIKESGDTLLAVVNDILDLAKIEAGMVSLETLAFDLSDLLASIILPFEPLANSKGVGISFKISEGVSGVYIGDPTRLRQILYNMISNAIKFTQVGQITLAAAQEDGKLRLSVSDTGIGIAADRLEALFQPFTQADATTTRRFGGTGLGLSICSQLAALMEGEIDVQSTLGQGTVFTLTLPSVQAGAPDLMPVAEAFSGRDPRAGIEGQVGNALAPRILAAEDNGVNQLVLRTLLTHSGIEPVIVSDGVEALAAFEGSTWDAILMDIQMPIMNGIQATQRIREIEGVTGQSRTPIIALTANALSHQVAEYLSLGFDGHVAKPFEVAALLAAIDMALSQVTETK